MSSLTPSAFGPERRGGGLGALLVEIADDDLGALLHIALGDRLADAARRAGDESDLVLDNHLVTFIVP